MGYFARMWNVARTHGLRRVLAYRLAELMFNTIPSSCGYLPAEAPRRCASIEGNYPEKIEESSSVVQPEPAKPATKPVAVFNPRPENIQESRSGVNKYHPSDFDSPERNKPYFEDKNPDFDFFLNRPNRLPPSDSDDELARSRSECGRNSRNVWDRHVWTQQDDDIFNAYIRGFTAYWRKRGR